MKLKTLLKDVPVEIVKGSRDVEITGISENSKLVAPGHLFISKKGSSGEGHLYMMEAAMAGCAAVVTDLYNPFLGRATQVIHPNAAVIEGKLVSNFYQSPSEELLMVGITGTSGKTTCTYLGKQLLDRLSMHCGLIGTVGYIVGNTHHKATLTTPDVITNHRLLREMVTAGCKACVMEVSSHALEQGRVNEINFDVGIFTNLSPEHLDYHKDMDSYAKAKSKLFERLKQLAIVNHDSPYSKTMMQGCKVPILSYGLLPGADIVAHDIVLGSSGSTFVVEYQGEKVPFHIPLLGQFNVSNCLALVALGIYLKAPLEQIATIMKDVPRIPGRLEPVPNKANLKIFVDYAHKTEALRNVLLALRELQTDGKILTVFGCGGNRDRGKRPKMAEVAEELSDHVIVTTDNPRDEEPQMIIKEIISGFRSNDKYCIEEDRRSAIAKAISMAGPEDIILIAGKGHETYQIFGHKTIEFDDRLVAKEICNETT